MVLGGSSSAPNLQDYARVHRKKLTSSGFLDGMCKHAHISRRRKIKLIIIIIFLMQMKLNIELMEQNKNIFLL